MNQPDENQSKVFEADVIEALREVHDPEIPVNVYDLGLIYRIKIDGNKVHVDMTLTSPNCPEAQTIPPTVARTIKQFVPGAKEVSVDIVWEPKWSPQRMSEDAKLALGFGF